MYIYIYTILIEFVQAPGYHEHAHKFVCMYIYMCIIHIYTKVYNTHIYKIYTYTYIYIHTHIHRYTNVHNTHIYKIYTYTFTHIYTALTEFVQAPGHYEHAQNKSLQQREVKRATQGGGG